MEMENEYREIWIDYHTADFLDRDDFTEYLKGIGFKKAGIDVWRNDNEIEIQAKLNAFRIFRIPTYKINKFGIKEKAYKVNARLCLDLLVKPKDVIGYDAKKRGTAKKHIFNLMGKRYPEHKEWYNHTYQRDLFA